MDQDRFQVNQDISVNKILIIILNYLLIGCISLKGNQDQVNQVFSDLSGFSYEKSEKYTDIDSIPENKLNAIKKRLPKEKKMPLVSHDQFINHMKAMENKKIGYRISGYRIFRKAYMYNNFILLDYDIKLSRYRVPTRLIIQFSPDSDKIKTILVTGKSNPAEREKFNSFIRIKSKVYSEQFDTGDEELY